LEALEGPESVQVFCFDGKRSVRGLPKPVEPGPWTRKRTLLEKIPASLLLGFRCARWWAYEQSLRWISAGKRYDLYHETGFVPAAQSRLPTVFSLYDLSLLRYAETHPRDRVLFFEMYMKRRLHHATHILTISRFVQDEIQDLFRWPEGRISAVPLAPDAVFFPRPADRVVHVKKRLGIPGDYLLFVGSLEPRKNLWGLIQALRICRSHIPLVLVGWSGWGEKTWLGEACRHLGQRLIGLGFVDDELLACLYSGASALVYPSLYEGFGLPIVEAMACGCPVICSNTSSMPEVAGGAARLVDPRDPEDLAAAIDHVLESSQYRQELIRKGLARAARYSWERTARETRAVFEKVLEEARS
jgi:alpha-1,3-rhamnosyl/mannosyltransferase